MTPAGIPYFPTRWFVNNTLSSTMCFSDTKVISKFKPVTYSPLLTKHHPRCSKIENYTNTHTTQLYFTDNFLCSFYLFSQSQQSLTHTLFFESPKLSLSFFDCSCFPMNVRMEQRVSPISVSSTNYLTSHHPQLSTFFYFTCLQIFYALPNITIYQGYKIKYTHLHMS